MNQFDVMQYGFWGLVAIILVVGGQSVIAYIKSPSPPKFSVLLIILFFVLSVSVGYIGYLWAEKEVQIAEARKTEANFIQSEISAARKRLKVITTNLHTAREKALNNSVDVANPRDARSEYLARAKDFTEVIENQEKHYKNEIESISSAFSKAANVEEQNY